MDAKVPTTSCTSTELLRYYFTKAVGKPQRVMVFESNEAMAHEYGCEKCFSLLQHKAITICDRSCFFFFLLFSSFEAAQRRLSKKTLTKANHLLLIERQEKLHRFTFFRLSRCAFSSSRTS